jgi:hypothetical protein
MTPARRRLQIAPPWSALRAAALAAACVLAFGVGPKAAVTERIVADRHSGLAIDGFDPVAYFTDGEAREGRPELEQPFAGVVWRFRNEGNRAAFQADPFVYMPCFGGYDPVGVARGVATPGHPMVFAIVRGRLCLFYSEAAREKFLAGAGRVMAAAENRWEQVSATLAQ